MSESLAFPTPLSTLRALARGYAPRLIQGRGWVLAALAILPPAIALALSTLLKNGPAPQFLALQVFHQALTIVAVPVMALIAAPAGIREDLEQRTLPLLLVRPAPVWLLPFGKGLLWFGWGSLWLILAAAALLPLHQSPGAFATQALALVLGFWAELGFLALLGLIFKRGTLWGALWFFLVDPLARVLPGKLQMLTFVHHLQRIAGSQHAELRTQDILAQEMHPTAPWLAALVLLAIGAICWVLAGWRLYRTPLGLAGRDAEG